MTISIVIWLAIVSRRGIAKIVLSRRHGVSPPKPWRRASLVVSPTSDGITPPVVVIITIPPIVFTFATFHDVVLRTR
jgi:hypothetical protein